MEVWSFMGEFGVFVFKVVVEGFILGKKGVVLVFGCWIYLDLLIMGIS